MVYVPGLVVSIPQYCSPTLEYTWGDPTVAFNGDREFNQACKTRMGGQGQAYMIQERFIESLQRTKVKDFIHVPSLTLVQHIPDLRRLLSCR